MAGCDARRLGEIWPVMAVEAGSVKVSFGAARDGMAVRVWLVWARNGQVGKGEAGYDEAVMARAGEAGSDVAWFGGRGSTCRGKAGRLYEMKTEKRFFGSRTCPESPTQ
jgi:hypothetical protein